MWRRVWIWKRKLKGGTTYCIRWCDKRGRVRTETVGPDRKLAERARTRREADLNSGRYTYVKRVPFDEFMEEELELMEGRLAPGTLEQVRISLDHFERICEPGPVSDIDVPTVERFHSARLSEVSEATANKDLRHLQASLTRAVRRGYLAENPAKAVRPVREAEKAIRVLSPEEVGELLDACPTPWWRALVAVAVTTGMRRGELLALRWEDVDLEDRTVRVENTPEHKTKSRRRRALALPEPVCGLLRGLPRRGDLVFAGQDGTSIRGDTASKAFAEIVEDAGIDYCTLHDLRRTFVSHLARAGVNAALVQKLAGHSAIATTVKYYTGVMPDSLREAQGRLPFDEVIGCGARTVSDLYQMGENSADSDADGREARKKKKIIKLFSDAS